MQTIDTARSDATGNETPGNGRCRNNHAWMLAAAALLLILPGCGIEDHDVYVDPDERFLIELPRRLENQDPEEIEDDLVSASPDAERGLAASETLFVASREDGRLGTWGIVMTPSEELLRTAGSGEAVAEALARSPFLQGYRTETVDGVRFHEASMTTDIGGASWKGTYAHAFHEGRIWKLAFQSPAAEWEEWAPRFRASVASLRFDEGKIQAEIEHQEAGFFAGLANGFLIFPRLLLRAFGFSLGREPGFVTVGYHIGWFLGIIVMGIYLWGSRS